MNEPVVVDARGDRCPVPVVKAARAARGLPAGAVLLLLSDDPVAAVDVPAWAWMRGHAVEAVAEDGWTVFTVVVGGAPADQAGGGAARST